MSEYHCTNTVPAKMCIDTDTDAQGELKLSDHLVQLPGGSWALWHWAGLRGPGFPASHVLQLSAPICASAADQLLQAEDEAEGARHKALAALSRMLESLS